MQTFPVPIHHQDEHLLIVHKPAGLLVHRTALDRHEHDSLLDRLREWLPPADAAGLAPAHRLDKGTSGLLIFTRHAEAARQMRRLFDQGRVHKRYLALVRGWPTPTGACDHPLARDPERPSQGQVHLPAVTRYRRLARVEWPLSVDPRFPTARYALMEAEPLTGRRHQIRRHFKHLAHPLVGDATHGKGPHNRAVAAWTGCTPGRMPVGAPPLAAAGTDDGCDGEPDPDEAEADEAGADGDGPPGPVGGPMGDIAPSDIWVPR